MPARTYAPDSPLADPEFRRERARKGGHARNGPDATIKRLESLASDLTDEQRARLAAILATPRRAD